MNKITMLNSEFSIEKLFPNNNEVATKDQFKTSPFSELIKLKNSKTTLFKEDFNQPGIYVFWWIGDEEDLKNLNTKILIKGKVDNKSTDQNGKPGHYYHKIDFSAKWNPTFSPSKIALYVGKSTNIANRFSLHLKTKTLHSHWNNTMKEGKNNDKVS
jgi:hypothetical protein